MASIPPPAYSSRPSSVANLRNGNCSYSESAFPTFGLSETGSMTSEEQLMRSNESLQRHYTIGNKETVQI